VSLFTQPDIVRQSLASYNALMIAAPTTDILDSILDPFTDCFTPEVAARILAVRLDPRRQARIDELAVKANEGQLSEAEDREYAGYIEALDLVGIIKAKARLALTRQAS
jgi:hypothetical protein